MNVFDLEIGDLFSFKSDSPVYMVTRNSGHIEYQSYNDGKIRVINKGEKLDRNIYLRPDYEMRFERKYFVELPQ